MPNALKDIIHDQYFHRVHLVSREKEWYGRVWRRQYSDNYSATHDLKNEVTIYVLSANRPYSRRGHDGQKERLGLQIYRNFARQYVNCDATSLLLHVPVT